MILLRIGVVSSTGLCVYATARQKEEDGETPVRDKRDRPVTYVFCGWSSLKLMWSGLLQKDFVKGGWSTAEKLFKQNYCHARHTKFAVFFLLLSCCVSSLLSIIDRDDRWRHNARLMTSSVQQNTRWPGLSWPCNDTKVQKRCLLALFLRSKLRSVLRFYDFVRCAAWTMHHGSPSKSVILPCSEICLAIGLGECGCPRRKQGVSKTTTNLTRLL